MKPSKKEIWHHNSFLGFAAMTVSHMQTIAGAPTATAEAKATAEAIFHLARRLAEELKTRKDQE